MPNDNIQILLVDDDEDDRLFFIEAMIQTGQNLIINVAKNGFELMNFLKNGKMKMPFVIFLDLNMPLKNGRECLQEIKSDEILKNIPVIIFSTSKSEEQVDLAFNLGANLYITKPNSISKLEKIFTDIFKLECKDYMPQPERGKFYFVY